MLARLTVKSIGRSARSRVSIPIPQSVCIPTIARDHAATCEYKSRDVYLGKCSFIFNHFSVLLRLNLPQA